ncbi:saccharopine dehydrogenase C-terminal domain-containing protein [Aridibaculum aurantiacum]|uniref:saccharopine dehydrogenase C-terminal domain-containing protein n=1 Tax=Aridibaculum aurantiacum TaxID=2810307 RepID=UPI001A95F960|nr:saccharopine dehydrogenase C-terminal domain-containing protein [Aridibaculum aurantiacum]
MNHILLFGAGKSATVLINYLKDLATEKKYSVTIADGNLEAVQSKVGTHPLVKGVKADVENEFERHALIKQADVVISLLPPSLHYLVALDCLEYEKHLLTASYVDDKIKALEEEVKQKGLLFLCEMGLDPGIDHMSAMELVHRIKAMGGTITSFKSHCGGLVAPESDNNPWHYKISWNPRNIILAGKSGAVYKVRGQQVSLSYEELFNIENLVDVPGHSLLAFYPNRDSLNYLPLYQLHEAETFIRTTLRHPDFTFGWKNIIDLKLTDEEYIYDTTNMTVADFFKIHFEKYGFSEWLNEMLSTRLTYAKDLMENLIQLIETEEEQRAEGGEVDDTIMMVNEKGELDTVEVEEVKDKAAAALAIKMHEANLSLKQLFYLGLDSEEVLNIGHCTAAQILQHILEEKLKLEPEDKDMVVMMHEIQYELEGYMQEIKSTMIVKGENSTHTAMAKTVGLPLGIAARLILEGKLTQRGLQIPISSSIYIPVLAELEKHDIYFVESIIS